MYAILSWLLKSVDPWVKSMYCIRFLQISQESALGQHGHWGLGSLGLRDGSLCLLWHDHLAAAGRWCRCNLFVTPMNYGMVPPVAIVHTTPILLPCSKALGSEWVTLQIPMMGSMDRNPGWWAWWGAVLYQSCEVMVSPYLPKNDPIESESPIQWSQEYGTSSPMKNHGFWCWIWTGNGIYHRLHLAIEVVQPFARQVFNFQSDVLATATRIARDAFSRCPMGEGVS